MSEIPLGLYLFKRLHSLGIRSIFGVPGDYSKCPIVQSRWNCANPITQTLLSSITSTKSMDSIGLAIVCVSSKSPLIVGNELNASYAADGYARVKGLSALITTFGNCNQYIEYTV
jgi:pyruvate decarboxylase